MTTQTKTERQESARKAVATRHQNDAIKAAKRARKDVESAFSSLGSAAKSGRDATVLAGKSVVSRVGVSRSD